MMNKHFLLSLVLLAGALSGVGAPASSMAAVARDASSVTVPLTSGTLRLRVFSPRVVEVSYGLGAAAPSGRSLSVIAQPARTRWKLSESAAEISLRTDELLVKVDRSSGAVSFCDKSGAPILREKSGGGKSLLPAHVGPIDTYKSIQAFELPPDEALYGLGQHPDAPMNYHGARLHLQQENRIVGVPVLLSSRGYGLLWDNPAVTDVDAGATEASTLSWTSEAADGIDYYFIYGPELDGVIGSVRELTGQAPMFAKWTWGLWQCREHYETQKEVLGILDGYRKRHIPLDAVIQDWQYWLPGGWGSHEFDPARYPDPAGMVKAVHDANAHIIISIWPRFDLGLTNLGRLEQAGVAFPPVYPNVYPPGKGKWYDPYSAEGRRLYWKFLSEKLYPLGFDGWWMDASEAELGGNWGEMRNLVTGAGPGAKVFNAYPLMHSKGVFEGQRAEDARKRVFILTRSAFAGQQRNAAVTWSGDTHGTWEIFRKQVPAGLNFVATGIPYWNTDIGAFFGGDPKDPKYAELFARWFQFGAFCPMFRVHGTGKSKEVWRFAPAIQQVLTNYIALRYHLLPYIYSDAWRVTSRHGTMMRPLVMDFRGDTNVFGIPDQYLFGPSIMACPVMNPGVASRQVYLPAGTSWYDFWTGDTSAGGRSLAARAPLDTMPLYVRAGSILPYGPSVEYAAEKCDPLELRVYRGADAKFTLYEDEGDNYSYERGAYATIQLEWNEREQTLVLGKRQGKFPGMLAERDFRIVWVTPGHGAGIASTENPDARVHYTGKELKISAPKPTAAGLK
jgi:alpha-D-xyloside xylohydrolase